MFKGNFFNMAKRVFLFVVVNILVVLTLSITAQVLMAFFGISIEGMGGMLFLYGMIGMGGAMFSLFISKFMAKSMMGVKIIDPRTNDPTLRLLVERVHDLSRRAGLKKMPEVGIYENPEVNAFATGPSRNNSLVAVSTGLLNRMDRDQVEGVLGHEVAHIANGDMVTMTLLQGVINTVVLVLSRLISSVLTSQLDERARFGAQIALFYVLQILLGILGSLVVNAFSRYREFRADAGGARIAGREKMISALRALAGTATAVDEEHKAFASFKISGGGMMRWFSTHPPLEERIARLERARL